jgi:hypothetical protein
LARPNVSLHGDDQDSFEAAYVNCQISRLRAFIDHQLPQQRNKTTKSKPPSSNHPLFVVMEIGCGDSVHSLRLESDLLLHIHDNVALIRVNLSDATIPAHGGDSIENSISSRAVSLEMGALDALTRLAKELT